jgi:AcrR family transcriptional regulator
MPCRPAAAVHAPRQPRSLLTQERILAAMESLLAEGDPDRITMEELAARAHVSVGAIYKRFRDKTALRPLVLERVQEQLFRRLQELLAQPRWADAGLGARIDGLLGEFARAQHARRQLLRALVVGHWQSEEPAPARSAELLAAMHAWLAERAGEIDHPDPARALSLGLFATLQALQVAVLMDRVPPDLGLERFTAEMARLFRRYLGLPDAGDPAGAGGPAVAAAAPAATSPDRGPPPGRD